MTARLLIKEGPEIRRVHQVSVDADRQAKRRVHVKGLRLRSVRESVRASQARVVSWRKSGSSP